MSKVSIYIGILLVVVGIAFYLGTGRTAMTAMIPAFFGLPVVLLGLWSNSAERRGRMMAAHIAVLITLLGTLGGIVMGIISISKGKAATVVADQLIMGVLCALHLILSVRSFIQARKAEATNT